MLGSNNYFDKERLNREFQLYKNGHRAGYMSVTEVEDIAIYNNLEIKKIYPKAGDLLLVDTRGIHKRNQPKGGMRISLNSIYDYKYA